MGRRGVPQPAGARRYGAALVVLVLLWVTGCTEAAVPMDQPVAAPQGPAAAAAAGPDTTPELPRAPAAADGPRPPRDSPPPATQPPPAPQSPPPPPERPAPAGEKAAVLYLGDSLAMESQVALGEHVSAGGRASVHSAPYSGTTLCDYLTGRATRSLVPPRDKAAALVATHRPRVVVLQFWGNSWGFTPCMDGIPQGSDRYYARYAQDAEALTAQIALAARNAGIPRPRLVWVLQGPDAFSADRTHRVNDLYRAHASATGDTVADAGHEVSAPGARYQWRQRVPCNATERSRPGQCRDGLTALHRDDDPLHFCLAPTTPKARPCPTASPGIERYTRTIAAVVDRYVR
ncbi:SGNH/GDSL hydrolase family protein [Streptomyces sp. NPDC091272]|uniref:SGNH/GDSL hydrolase family protein n=1 Tax=Streptomyces sp. NPDC091272 TaxID=3365981 RepID=UPI00381D4A56